MYYNFSLFFFSLCDWGAALAVNMQNSKLKPSSNLLPVVPVRIHLWFWHKLQKKKEKVPGEDKMYQTQGYKRPKKQNFTLYSKSGLGKSTCTSGFVHANKPPCGVWSYYLKLFTFVFSIVNSIQNVLYLKKTLIGCSIFKFCSTCSSVQLYLKSNILI